MLTAGVAEELGVSDAVGASMAGVVPAATLSTSRIERLVRVKATPRAARW